MTDIQLEQEVMQITRMKPHTLRRIAAHVSEPLGNETLKEAIEAMLRKGIVVTRLQKGVMQYQAVR